MQRGSCRWFRATVVAPARLRADRRPCYATRVRSTGRGRCRSIRGRPQDVERAELADDSIARPVVVALALVSAEHPVPDDEDAGIIAVEIARIDGMMDAMVRWRVHHRLEPGRHPPDHLGMDPELVDEIDPGAEKHHRRRESDQEQGQAEKKGGTEEAGPGLPQRRRQIIMLARMVDDVAGPEPAHPVRGAVEDIKANRRARNRRSRPTQPISTGGTGRPT